MPTGPTARYVINAKLTIENTSTIATTTVCDLKAGSDVDTILSRVGADDTNNDIPTRDAMAGQLVHTTAGPASVTLECRVGNLTTGTASDVRITAIRVGSVTNGALATS